MAQGNTVSFKAYLFNGDTNGKSEVRRFGIDCDVIPSFDYLKEKLQTVFPTLRNQNFSVMWKDSDNDDVVISSDDELIIALSEVQSEVRKLYLKVLDASGNPPNTNTGLPNEATDCVHEDVICDMCDKQIKGYRYHCMECFDYDLCGQCEAKKVHCEHVMIRLATPVPTVILTAYVRSMRSFLHILKGHPIGHGHKRDRRHHCDGRGKWPLDKIINPMGPYLDPIVRDCLSANEKGKKNASDEKSRKGGNKKDYLWSLGQRIAAVLDPWGIDVDVEVRTRDENENKNEEGKKGEEMMETEETEKDEVQNKDPKCNAGEDSNEAGPSRAYVANTAAQSEHATQGIDDWTVLNAAFAEQQQENAKSPEPAVAATYANQVQDGAEKPMSATDAPKQVGVGASVNKAQGEAGIPSFSRIYPYIPLAAETSRMPAYQRTSSSRFEGLVRTDIPTSGTNVAIHPEAMPRPPIGSIIPNLYGYTSPQAYSTYTRPHVADAVQKMMAMGFSNEGGWLTQLLEIKNGDIEKALDVLQPVKRS